MDPSALRLIILALAALLLPVLVLLLGLLAIPLDISALLAILVLIVARCLLCHFGSLLFVPRWGDRKKIRPW
ncbi:hypothetical protein SLG_18090 [Sphingobium sp. SYK-6]|nr:hypothetical protein SLG_18090 [Sphingobium sp. SYK-6]